MGQATGYISEVPDFKGVFIREDRKKPVIIPEEDFMEMVKALRKPELVLRHCSADWWRMFLYIAYYLGLRRGEILGSHLGQGVPGDPGGPCVGPHFEVSKGTGGADVLRSGDVVP